MQQYELFPSNDDTKYYHTISDLIELRHLLINKTIVYT